MTRSRWLKGEKRKQQGQAHTDEPEGVGEAWTLLPESLRLELKHGDR